MSSLTSGTLIWGFNFFQFVSTSSGYIHFQLNQTTSLNIDTLTSNAVLSPNIWTFVAGSFQNYNSTYKVLLYAIRQDQTYLTETRNYGSGTINYPSYINYLLVGCQGNFNSLGSFTPIPGISFNGNIRELVYLNKFHEVSSLEDGKKRVYSSCLQIYNDVLSYWRFDVLTPNNGGYTLFDSSKYAQTANTASNPTKNII